MLASPQDFSGRHVRVSADDIARGMRHSRCQCPVALGLCRSLGVGVNHWFDDDTLPDNLSAVGPHAVEFGWLRFYALPDAARTFITRFDAGKPVGPFTFRLGRRMEFATRQEREHLETSRREAGS